MKFQKYTKYKASGVEWLGEIPEEWEVKRLKDIFLMNRGKFTHRPRNDPKMYGGNFPFLQTGSVSISKKYITEYKQTLSKLGTTVSKQFPKETILMTIAANIGDVAVLSFDAYFPDSIIGFKSSKKNDNNFSYYFLKILKKPLNQVKITNTQDNINLERLDIFERALPPKQTQTKIANYLDEKTNLIDKKISLLQKKKEKYKELKQTLINEVVTKGLDKTVKMKDSEIEWVGEIPEHWEVKRLKDFILYTIGGEVIDVSYWGNGNELLFTAGKNPVKSNFENFPQRKRTKINDILIARNGDGFIHMPPINSVFTNVVQLVRLSKIVNKNFIWYFLENIKFIINQTSNGDFIASLNKDMWFNSFLVIPPKQEQIQIANYLDEKTGKIDEIIEKVDENIKVLKEFRKTLINDAVTGKIKVA